MTDPMLRGALSAEDAAVFKPATGAMHAIATRKPTSFSGSTRLVIIATVPETVMSFLVDQIRFLTTEGFEVHVITSPGLENFPGHRELVSARHDVSMTRAIDPIADLKSLIKIWRLLREIRPTIVQTRTPKAGLLGMLAGWLARVPVRIYTVDGLPSSSHRKTGRALIAFSDWLACRLASQVLCVSRSVRRFMVGGGLCRREKSRVLGAGSVCGVDVRKFSPDACGISERNRIRDSYNIPRDALVIGFVGRLVPDKGMAELACAWETLRAEFPEAHLLLCGYFEPVHPLPASIAEKLIGDPRVHITGRWLNDMPAVYAALDVCVLPSYRGGLSTVALESSAMRVPIVATRVPGCVDCIRNGVTGLLVEPRDAVALTDAIRRLLNDPQLRAQIGAASRDFVSRRFS